MDTFSTRGISLFLSRDVLISTTGLVYREVPEATSGGGLGHERDLLILGAMGHSASVAVGVALGQPDRQIYCLDGGSGTAGTTALAHLGTTTTAGQLARSPGLLNNFHHIVLTDVALPTVCVTALITDR